MFSVEILDFISRLNEDPENKEIRRSFHENYEWLESYWKQKYGGNNGDQIFCNNHGEFYWEIIDVKNIAKRITKILPVGNSNRNFEPSINILRATYFLKYKSGLYLKENIEEIDDQVAHANNWKNGYFHAAFVIIKQIRDNLFHGRKVDLDLIQYDRNKILVGIGKEFTDALLLNLKEAEEQLQIN